MDNMDMDVVCNSIERLNCPVPIQNSKNESDKVRIEEREVGIEVKDKILIFVQNRKKKKQLTKRIHSM